MKPKNFISRCELLEDLRAAVTDRNRLDGALEKFSAQLELTTQRSHSKFELLRLYAYVHQVFSLLKTKNPQNDTRYHYLDAALALLETECHIILFGLRHPGLFDTPEKRKETSASPLVWTTYTSTDLMELVIALHVAGAIRTKDGQPASLRMLVQSFERLFNISIRNAERCAYATLDRKLKLTKFLNILRDALIERSGR